MTGKEYEESGGDSAVGAEKYVDQSDLTAAMCPQLSKTLFLSAIPRVWVPSLKEMAGKSEFSPGFLKTARLTPNSNVVFPKQWWPWLCTFPDPGVTNRDFRAPDGSCELLSYFPWR